jgi:Flp pilus assembly pilin Flp
VNSILMKLYLRVQVLAIGTDGQDLVEYALVIGLLSFGITASSNFLATALVTAFKGISTTLGSYVS